MAGTPYIPVRQVRVNSTGRPHAGARAYFYDAGTTSARSVYTSAARTVAHTNPVVANAAGLFPAIYLDPAYNYRCITQTSAGVAIDDEDNIPGTSVTADQVGLALYPRTDTEVSAGVTPVNYQYPPGNVRRYGAEGDGTTDDTAAFLAASQSSANVDVPDGTYYVDGLVVGEGVHISGAGTIKTGSEELIALPMVNLRRDDSVMRVMFAESNDLGWEEMLDIKACGYNTIMVYLWHVDLDDVIYNAEAVGLKVLVHSRIVSGNIAQASTLAAAATAYDARPSVVGYYVFDEPVGNSISVGDQDTVITAFRALTYKPLFCAEFTVVYATTGYLSENYDGIFIDSYYPTSSSTANDSLAAYIRCAVAYGTTAQRARIIPLVGLFNDSGFTKSTTLTRQLAETLVKFSKDGSFGAFCWNAGTAGTYEGIRNTAVYRASAKRLGAIASGQKPYTIDLIPIGTQFSSSNALDRRWVNCVDGASPNVIGESNLVPWYVADVNLATDDREQDFTDNGLMLQGTSGQVGFAGAPSGICCGILYWDDRDVTDDDCTVVLGSSSTNGYTMSEEISQAIVNGAGAAFYGQLDSGGDFWKMPVLRVDVDSAVAFPYCFVKGYLAFTDVPEVNF
jgi:hypothetical protein